MLLTAAAFPLPTCGERDRVRGCLRREGLLAARGAAVSITAQSLPRVGRVERSVTRHLFGAQCGGLRCAPPALRRFGGMRCAFPPYFGRPLSQIEKGGLVLALHDDVEAVARRA